MELTIVNPDPRYAPVTLVEPATLGYLHIGAEVRPRGLPPLQRLPAGREKAELLRTLHELAHRLEDLEAVEKVTIYDAVAIAPARFGYLRERADSIHVARFDVVVLIETRSVADIREVRRSEQYEALLAALRRHARRQARSGGAVRLQHHPLALRPAFGPPAGQRQQAAQLRREQEMRFDPTGLRERLLARRSAAKS